MCGAVGICRGAERPAMRRPASPSGRVKGSGRQHPSPQRCDGKGVQQLRPGREEGQGGGAGHGEEGGDGQGRGGEEETASRGNLTHPVGKSGPGHTHTGTASSEPRRLLLLFLLVLLLPLLLLLVLLHLLLARVCEGGRGRGKGVLGERAACGRSRSARLRCGVVGDKLQRDVSSAPDVVNYHQDLPGMSVLSRRCQDANYALTAGQRRAGCGAAPRGSNLRQRGPSGDEHQGRIRRRAGQLGPYALGRRAACAPGRGSAPGW